MVERISINLCPKLLVNQHILGVKKIQDAGHHAVGGVAGLYLYVTPPHG